MFYILLIIIISIVRLLYCDGGFPSIEVCVWSGTGDDEDTVTANQTELLWLWQIAASDGRFGFGSSRSVNSASVRHCQTESLC